MRKIAAVLAGVVTALVPLFATASPASGDIHPRVINQTCDEAVNATHGAHCLQASGGSGATVTMFAPNGQPNQQFDVNIPFSTVCGDNITDINCPFPGVTPGQDIAVIGGQAPTNHGSCVAVVTIRVQAKLTACNGGSGTVVVIDGHALEFAALSRQNNGKTYLCENPLNVPTERTVFTAGDCQWSTLPQ